MPNPYDIIEFRGHQFDRLTVAAILDVEADLGRELNITQGSYTPGFEKSGGTHDGGGAGDSMPATLEEARREERALRRRGFMAYVRPKLVRASGELVWNLHVHWGLMGNRKASPSLRAQFVEYAQGGDGLVGSGLDIGPREFVDVRYRWRRGEARITRARQRLDAVLNDLAAYNLTTGTGVRGYAVGAARKAARKARAELPHIPA
jgi:hypothetical protein